MDTEVNFYDSLITFQSNFTPQIVTNEVEDSPLLDALTEFVSDIIFFVVLSALVGAFGTVTNIINIIVYVRQGIFSAGSNLNLCSLALADLGVSFTTFLHGVGFAVIVAEVPGLLWDPFAIVYLAIGWPVMIFIMTNRLLTAYVAFERCLCVVLPFHIKSMFTIRRSLFYIVAIYAYTILSHVPIYIIHRLDFELEEGTNVSRLVLVFSADREVVHDIVFYSNSFFVTMATVVIVFVCTLITSTQIKTSKEWRKNVSASGDKKRIGNAIKSNNDGISENTTSSKSKKMTDETIDKETRLVKMITMVSVIYLICYVPEILLIVMKAIDNRIRLSGTYYRLAKLIYSFTFVTSGINSSVNIFIYYRMSSRYRKEFCKLFGMSEGKEKLER